jgi:multiple sugar transport system substrate-binding protein
MQALFAEMTSLYRLDQLNTGAGGKVVLGELPGEAVALLATLGAVWVCIGIYFLLSRKKKA